MAEADERQQRLVVSERRAAQDAASPCRVGSMSSKRQVRRGRRPAS